MVDGKDIFRRDFDLRIMKESTRAIVQKVVFFVVLYLLYQNLLYIFIAPGVYSEPAYVIYLIIAYTAALFDTLVRKVSEEEPEKKIYAILILLLFLAEPWFLIAAYYENTLLIAPSVPFWNSNGVMYVGFFLYVSACFLEVTARTEIGRFGTGDLVIEEDHQLYTEGIYKYIRHPIYTGGLIGIVGFGLVFRSIITLVGAAIVYFLILNMRAKEEERQLEEVFGDEYIEYKRTSKKFFPFIY